MKLPPRRWESQRLLYGDVIMGTIVSQITSLTNRLFRRRSKKTSKLRVTGLCVGNSPGTGEFPAQMTSNAENVSIWWRHHVLQHNTSGCEMVGKKAYELLNISFLRHEQFFTEWNGMVLLNININYSSCPGTTHMSLEVTGYVIIKTTMEPDPWTLITYSAYVLISWTQAMWHSLYGMWCNSIGVCV